MADVTVVISFFNNAGTVLDAVRSVFAQTMHAWELIVLDDGSTDGGLEQVRKITDPRLRIVRHEKNAGTPVRLNELSSLVTTPLLARMDADDLMHPERLVRSLEALDATPDGSFVYGSAVSIDATSAPTGLRCAPSDPSVTDHFRHAPFVHATVTGRTDWFRAHPYSESYRRCQDQELWVRTLGERLALMVEQPLLYLREAGTVPATKYATSMRGTRRVLREHGAERLGHARTLALLASTYAKQATYSAAERTRQTDRIVRSRSTPLSPAEAAKHGEIIQTIRSTPLPGIDD